MGVGIMFKTTGEACNLACDYCYYSHVSGNPSGMATISEKALDAFFEDYMGHVAGGQATFVWQGGEPTLAGLPYFERIIAMEARRARPHTLIGNAVQTNGILLNEAWSEFFRQYRFLVGVSLDGPAELHDARRVDAQHRGSFRRVMRGIDHLRKAGVQFNILTVLHQGNVHQAKALMDFYHSEGFDWVQFIPGMRFSAQGLVDPGVYEITPAEYASFLCEAFDELSNHPGMSVRMFDNFVNLMSGKGGDMCILQENCPPFLVVEQDGSVYPCDFLIGPHWRMGNIETDSVFDLIQGDIYRAFQQLKPRVALECTSCEWFSACHGGCPRTRGTTLGAQEVDYFCEAYKTFYAHAARRLAVAGRPLRSSEPIDFTF